MKIESDPNFPPSLLAPFEEAPGRRFGQPLGVASLIALGHRRSPESECAGRQGRPQHIAATGSAQQAAGERSSAGPSFSEGTATRPDRPPAT